MNNLTISIVVPSFNQGQYIEQTIDSIVSQSYPDKELIIIDGGSTDDTLDVIKKYNKHIAWWVSEKDRGQAHAINKGLQKATGEIFNWLNSDDYLEEDALQHIAQVFQDNPTAKVVCGSTHCFYEETGQASHTYRMGLKETPTETLLDIEMNQPGTFYKTDIVKILGGINELFRYVIDDELWMRYLMKYGQKDVLLIDHLLAHFRLHGSSKTVGEGYHEFMKERYSIYTWLAKEIKLPEFLIEKIEEKNLISYSSSYQWDLTYFDKRAFEAHFAGLWMHHFYRHFQYQEARYCFRKYWKGNSNVNVLQHFYFIIKLFFVPIFLLNILRKANW